MRNIIRIERYRNLDNVRQKNSCRFCAGEEQTGIEGIRPLPGECKHEYRNHHRHSHRNDYADECLDNACTVDIGSLLEFIGDAVEILPHYINEQTVFEGETGDRKDDERPICIKHTGNGGCSDLRAEYIFRNEAVYTPDIEISELHEHRKLERFMRHDHCENDAQEDEIFEFELEFREAVTDDRADKCLRYAAQHRENGCVQQCLKVIVIVDYGAVGIKCGFTRDKLYHNVGEVVPAHERTGYL